MYVYKRSEPQLYTVGYYDPEGNWNPESDHSERAAAAARVAYLNGAGAVRQVLDQALNEGDGSYKP